MNLHIQPRLPPPQLLYLPVPPLLALLNRFNLLEKAIKDEANEGLNKLSFFKRNLGHEHVAVHLLLSFAGLDEVLVAPQCLVMLVH